jgi:hypothetical protein
MGHLLDSLRGRAPVAVAMLVALAAALAWLEGRFETADVKKGIVLALRHRAAPGGASVFDALAARGEGDPRCEGEIVSKLFGDVRVRCAAPGRPDVRYDFRVLLQGKRPPRGENAAARALLADLARAPPLGG